MKDAGQLTNRDFIRNAKSVNWTSFSDFTFDHGIILTESVEISNLDSNIHNHKLTKKIEHKNHEEYSFIGSCTSDFLEMWSKWSDFSGRTSQAKFWRFIFVDFVLISVAYPVVALVLLILTQTEYSLYFVAPIVMIYALMGIPVRLSAYVRRLHDSGQSGVWLIAMLIFPFTLYFIYLIIKKGDSGQNLYGNPDM